MQVSKAHQHICAEHGDFVPQLKVEGLVVHATIKLTFHGGKWGGGGSCGTHSETLALK